MRTQSRLAAALVVGALALLGSVPALAQAQGSTTVSVQIPDIVILHYFSTIDVTIDANAMGTFLTGTPGNSALDEGAGSGTASVVGGTLQADVAMVPSALSGDATAALLVLQNAWAVRAVSLGAPASETQLDVVVTTPTLSNVGLGTSMTISSAAVTDGVGAAAPTITFATPGLGTPEIGDVELTLDMTLASGAGTYTGGVFTLTATNI